eukprot:jgi/Botrbrau1/5925/Bobra.0366s0099.1
MDSLRGPSNTVWVTHSRQHNDHLGEKTRMDREKGGNNECKFGSSVFHQARCPGPRAAQACRRNGPSHILRSQKQHTCCLEWPPLPPASLGRHAD